MFSKAFKKKKKIKTPASSSTDVQECQACRAPVNCLSLYTLVASANQGCSVSNWTEGFHSFGLHIRRSCLNISYEKCNLWIAFAFYFHLQKNLFCGQSLLVTYTVFLRLNLLCGGLKNWNGQFYTAWFAERLPHSKAKLPYWKQVMKIVAIILGLPFQVTEHFLKLNWVFWYFSTCQKGWVWL